MRDLINTIEYAEMQACFEVMVRGIEDGEEKARALAQQFVGTLQVRSRRYHLQDECVGLSSGRGG